MLVKFNPNEDRVLVLQADAAAKTGSFFIPETSQEKPGRGRVVAVGPGKMISVACKKCGDSVVQMTPMPQIGQYFAFPPNAGVDIWIDGITFRILRAADLHGDDPDLFDATCPELVEKRKALDKAPNVPLPETMVE